MSAVVGTLLASMAETEPSKLGLRTAAVDFLVDRLGTKAERATESTLDHADATIRFQAANVLQFLHSDRAVDRLIAALKDPDSDVRAMVTHALTLQNDMKAVPALREVAKHDPVPGVRKQAKAAVGALYKASGGLP